MPSASCDGTTTPPPERRSSRRSLSTDKTFHIVHLGCAKNLYDAELMAGALVNAGWRESADPEGAQAILINSCGFIEAAISESVETVLEYTAGYPDSAVVMTGCLAQRYPEQIAMEIPELAGVFGNRRPEAIPQFLSRVAGPSAPRRPSGKPTFWDAPPGDPDWRHRTALRPTLYTPAGTAYVKIAEGCTHNCAFCAIPQIRGTLRSRSVDAVVREVEDLLSRGIREINLIAQDLSILGLEEGRRDFLPLLERISELPGHFWVRLLYIYPEHFPRQLLSICRRDPRILPYFDLPIQHADPGVLEAMGRPATPERTLETLDRIRSQLPDSVIRTTFLVGFPGEDQAAFDTLLAFQAAARFDWMGAFVYSPQEGTAGYDLCRGPGAVARELAEERAQALYRRQESITTEGLSRFVGRVQELLVEEPVIGEDLYFARGAMQAPEVDGTVVLSAPEGSLTPGSFVSARITGVDGYDLRARPAVKP
ncbi:MAG: 30S ribosomal protein S12 methylthiotransferase RimO [Alkalispirochaetaceae bacterium]